MSAIDRVINALEARGLSVRDNPNGGWTAQCAGHEDRQASLSLSTGEDARVLMRCHAGCENEDIVRALDLELRDLFEDRESASTRSSPAKERRPRKKPPAPLPGGDQLAGWAERLLSDGPVLSRLCELRGWTREALAELAIGFDGARITLPIRDKSGRLVNVCRYTPNPKDGEAKMLSLSQRPRDLFPAPETIAGSEVWIVEGEPDAISARSLGLPAVGLPGVESAKRLDVERFSGFNRVNIVLDCDTPGRGAAAIVATRLVGAGIDARTLDLDSGRDDGFDVGDVVREAAQQRSDGLESAARELADRVRATSSPVDEAASVTGALIEEVVSFARRYVVLPGDAEALALALYVLHTWAIDGAHATPYLLVVSPEKRSGKTRLLEVLALLVRQPWHTNSTSEAAMFRKIEKDSPTLLLDEIDAVFGSASERTEPLRAILNSGNRRGVTVTRCVGKDHDVAEFSVFCPKVLAGIDKDNRVPETIRDRAIAIAMRRRHSGEDVARFRERKAHEAAAPIRENVTAWAPAVAHRLFKAEPALPNELGDRAGDAWEPLFAIADLAGGDWPTRARAAAITLSSNAEADETSSGTLLLSAMRRFMTGSGMSTADLLDAINGDDELPFGGWRDGKGLNANRLARTLKPYRIKPRTIRLGDETLKGYRTADMQDAWARYLPPTPDSVTANSDTDPANGPDPSRKNPREHRDVTGVTDVTANTNVADHGVQIEATEGDGRTAADLSDDEILSVFPGATLEHVGPAPKESGGGVHPIPGESYEDWEARLHRRFPEGSNGHEEIASPEEEEALERAARLIGGGR